MLRVLEADHRQILSHGQVVRPGSRPDSWQNPQFLEVLPVELRTRVLIGGIRKVEGKGQQVIGCESFIHARQLVISNPAPTVNTIPNATCPTITIERSQS